jgi:hypothetical protein
MTQSSPVTSHYLRSEPTCEPDRRRDVPVPVEPFLSAASVHPTANRTRNPTGNADSGRQQGSGI